MTVHIEILPERLENCPEWWQKMINHLVEENDKGVPWVYWDDVSNEKISAELAKYDAKILDFESIDWQLCFMSEVGLVHLKLRWA